MLQYLESNHRVVPVKPENVMQGNFYRVNEQGELEIVEYNWPRDAVVAYLNDLYDVDTFTTEQFAVDLTTLSEVPTPITLV